MPGGKRGSLAAVCLAVCLAVYRTLARPLAGWARAPCGSRPVARTSRPRQRRDSCGASGPAGRGRPGCEGPGRHEHSAQQSSPENLDGCGAAARGWHRLQGPPGVTGRGRGGAAFSRATARPAAAGRRPQGAVRSSARDVENSSRVGVRRPPPGRRGAIDPRADAVPSGRRRRSWGARAVRTRRGT